MTNEVILSLTASQQARGPPRVLPDRDPRQRPLLQTVRPAVHELRQVHAGTAAQETITEIFNPTIIRLF